MRRKRPKTPVRMTKPNRTTPHAKIENNNPHFEMKWGLLFVFGNPNSSGSY